LVKNNRANIWNYSNDSICCFTNSDNVDDVTIYVKYVDSNNNYVFDQFEDGESLYADENVTYGNTTISAGTPFASLIS
jgi:hypothetical protein